MGVWDTSGELKFNMLMPFFQLGAVEEAIVKLPLTGSLLQLSQNLHPGYLVDGVMHYPEDRRTFAVRSANSRSIASRGICLSPGKRKAAMESVQ